AERSVPACVPEVLQGGCPLLGRRGELERRLRQRASSTICGPAGGVLRRDQEELERAPSHRLELVFRIRPISARPAVRLRVVVGEEGAVLALPVAGRFLDPACDARVRARPLPTRQALVRDVARQDVAERKLLLAEERRAEPRGDELPFLEASQVGVDLLVVVEQGGDGAAPEDAADDGRL